MLHARHAFLWLNTAQNSRCRQARGPLLNGYVWLPAGRLAGSMESRSMRFLQLVSGKRSACVLVWCWLVGCG